MGGIIAERGTGPVGDDAETLAFFKSGNCSNSDINRSLIENADSISERAVRSFIDKIAVSRRAMHSGLTTILFSFSIGFMIAFATVSKIWWTVGRDKFAVNSIARILPCSATETAFGDIPNSQVAFRDLMDSCDFLQLSIYIIFDKIYRNSSKFSESS